MKKLVIVSLLGAMSCFAAAAPGAQESARVRAIWATMENRLSEQCDVWFDAGDYPACVNLLRFSAAADPSDYDVATNLGWMLENIDEYGEALTCYVRFRKENPRMPDAPFPEANFYFRKKTYSKVPPLLASTIASKPHPNSYRLLAHSYERLGLLPDALKVWKQLVADHPEDRAAKLNMTKVEREINSQGKPKAGTQ